MRGMLWWNDKENTICPGNEEPKAMRVSSFSVNLVLEVQSLSSLYVNRLLELRTLVLYEGKILCMAQM